MSKEPVITMLSWRTSTEVQATVLVQGTEVRVQGLKVPLGTPVPERDTVVLERAVQLHKQLQGEGYE